MAADVRDLELRTRALDHVRVLSRRYDDVVPVAVLRHGFDTPRGRIGYGTFYSGIYRPRQFAGPAALSLVTAPPKERRDAPYDDEYDEATGTFTYHYRRAQSDSARARMSAAADNRSLNEALRLGVPLVYFRGIAPGQCTRIAFERTCCARTARVARCVRCVRRRCCRRRTSSRTTTRAAPP